MIPEALVRSAVRANILASTNHLRLRLEAFGRSIRGGGLHIVGAEYSLETGVVDFFDDGPDRMPFVLRAIVNLVGRERLQFLTSVSPSEALAFVDRHGAVLQAARGPVPNLAEAVAGERIRGSWWGHPKGRAIFCGGRGGVRQSGRSGLQVGRRQGHVRAPPALTGAGQACGHDSPSSGWPKSGTSTHGAARTWGDKKRFQGGCQHEIKKEAKALSVAEAERVLAWLPGVAARAKGGLRRGKHSGRP